MLTWLVLHLNYKFEIHTEKSITQNQLKQSSQKNVSLTSHFGENNQVRFLSDGCCALCSITLFLFCIMCLHSLCFQAFFILPIVMGIKKEKVCFQSLNSRQRHRNVAKHFQQLFHVKK